MPALDANLTQNDLSKTVPVRYKSEFKEKPSMKEMKDYLESKEKHLKTILKGLTDQKIHLTSLLSELEDSI